jgi:outer membrane protein assembly factor BamB
MPLSRSVSAALVVLAPLLSQPSGATAAKRPGPQVADTGAAGGRDWLRFGWDVGRSGSSTAPTGIDAGNVGSLQRRQVELGGTVDASPVYLHAVQVGGAEHDALFVTTTYGETVAIDARSGAILWRYTPPGYDSWAGTARVTTATPVADATRRYIFAASPDGYVQKLAVADGRALWRTAITRLPRREKIASALNAFGGRVIATTGGYIGDAPPYQGHVAILDGADGRLLHVWNSLCSDRHGLIDPASCHGSDSAIWGRGGAVVDSTTGAIFVATGNGPWDGDTYWGDATVWLDADATRILGNYTPTNTALLNATDQDLGSTSPVLLGGDYLAQGGKDGKIRLLSRQGIAGARPHVGGELQTVPTPSGGDLFTAPAVVNDGATTWMFVADNGGTAAWTLDHGRLVPVWRNGHGGTSPVVAGGLLYVYDPRGALRVYDPETGRDVATLDCGGGHWNSPIVIDGIIALPEGNANHHRTGGVLDIWRLPSARAGPAGTG